MISTRSWANAAIDEQTLGRAAAATIDRCWHGSPSSRFLWLDCERCRESRRDHLAERDDYMRYTGYDCDNAAIKNDSRRHLGRRQKKDSTADYADMGG